MDINTKKSLAARMAICLVSGSALVACGGSDSSTSSNSQSKLLVNPASVKISIPAANVTASSTDAANIPGNAVDNNLGTHWTGGAASGNQWIQFKLPSCYTADFANISWYNGDQRQYTFTIEASANNGATWTTVKTVTSTGTSAALVQADFPDTAANMMRISSSGSNVSTKVSINEVEFWGSSGATCSGTVTTTTKASTTTTNSNTTTTASSGVDLFNATKKEYAMEIVSSAENSSTNWRAQFAYIEDINDGRGYTAGIIGFCSGTSDMLQLVQDYTNNFPSNGLAKYLPALRSVDGTSSHAGLDPNYKTAWANEAKLANFQKAQEKERDDVYFTPAVNKGKADGIRALGQFAYYDAAVVHGYDGMLSVRARAMARAKTPAQGGNETTYLNAFLDERVVEMKKEAAHSDVTRIETAQRPWLKAGNFNLNAPLKWSVYGQAFSIQ